MAIKDMQGDFVQPRLKLHCAYTLWGIVRQRVICTYISLLNDILCILWATCLAQGKRVEPLLRTQHQSPEVLVNLATARHLAPCLSFFVLLYSRIQKRWPRLQIMCEEMPTESRTVLMISSTSPNGYYTSNSNRSYNNQSCG